MMRVSVPMYVNVANFCFCGVSGVLLLFFIFVFIFWYVCGGFVVALDGNPEPDLVHATGCKQPTLKYCMLHD
jgi:hypothetical protein